MSTMAYNDCGDLHCHRHFTVPQTLDARPRLNMVGFSFGVAL